MLGNPFCPQSAWALQCLKAGMAKLPKQQRWWPTPLSGSSIPGRCSAAANGWLESKPVGLTVWGIVEVGPTDHHYSAPWILPLSYEYVQGCKLLLCSSCSCFFWKPGKPVSKALEFAQAWVAALLRLHVALCVKLKALVKWVHESISSPEGCEDLWENCAFPGSHIHSLLYWVGRFPWLHVVPRWPTVVPFFTPFSISCFFDYSQCKYLDFSVAGAVFVYTLHSSLWELHSLAASSQQSRSLSSKRNLLFYIKRIQYFFKSKYWCNLILTFDAMSSFLEFMWKHGQWLLHQSYERFFSIRWTDLYTFPWKIK